MVGMEYLVVDAAGFINMVPLNELADKIVTLREVVSEIRDKPTRQRLLANPLDIAYMEPDSASLAKIVDMARKTGDVAALSTTDVKVMAVTYMLEVRQKGGCGHLRTEPRIGKTTDFYDPKKKKVDDEQREEEAMAAGFGDGDEDDEGGWITPDNLMDKKSEMVRRREDAPPANQERVSVACLTSDFAMQNVMIQMGLNVASPTGKIISETKSWILRCTACFATTPRMEKLFCPKCGNKTLKRVSVTLNPDGTQEIHLSSRYHLSARGTKFPLPMPKGGKHSANPRVCEDQPGVNHRQTKLARSKTRAMDEDYACYGNVPFSKNDVTSKSAVMGIGHVTHYWEHKNPNAVGKSTGNRKKKRI